MYCTREQIEARYSAAQVRKWAVLDGESGDSLVDARITDAIETAESFINARLAGGPYSIPFASVPKLIESICIDIAASIIYMARGTIEVDADLRPIDRMSAIRREAERLLDMIRRGSLQLDLPSAKRYPAWGSRIDSD